MWYERKVIADWFDCRMEQTMATYIPKGRLSFVVADRFGRHSGRHLEAGVPLQIPSARSLKRLKKSRGGAGWWYCCCGLSPVERAAMEWVGNGAQWSPDAAFDSRRSGRYQVPITYYYRSIRACAGVKEGSNKLIKGERWSVHSRFSIINTIAVTHCTKKLNQMKSQYKCLVCITNGSACVHPYKNRVIFETFSTAVPLYYGGP